MLKTCPEVGSYKKYMELLRCLQEQVNKSHERTKNFELLLMNVNFIYYYYLIIGDVFGYVGLT